MNNRSVPVSTVLPHLVYRDIDEACDWLSRVFGFQEHFRYGQSVAGIQMFLGGAVIMIYRPTRANPKSGDCRIEHANDHCDCRGRWGSLYRTREQGATIWEELHETVYGERQYGVEDLDGHRWLFADHARDVSPEEWGATIANPMP